MIRRWSRVNNTNSLPFHNFFFIKKYKVLALVSSVRYKRSAWNYSTIRKKVWGKRKHLANWFFYFQIFSFWGLYFNKIKTYFKYQFLNLIFKFNYFYFDKNLYLNNFTKDVEFQNLFILSNLVKKSLCYFFNQFKLKLLPNITKNLSNTQLYSYSRNLGGSDKKTILLHSKHENALYIQPENQLLINNIFLLQNLNFKLYLNYLTEIYKINTLLVYFKSKNL